MIGIYVETETRLNLVVPFIVVGCFVKNPTTINALIKSNRATSLSYKDCAKAVEILEKNRRDFYLTYYEILNENISKFSLDVTVNKSISLIKFRIEAYLISSGLQTNINLALVTYSDNSIKLDSNTTYSIDLDLTIPEIFISYVYARIFRERYLKIFNFSFPELKLLNNRGSASKMNIKQILSFKILPYFFNKDLVFKAFLKYHDGSPSQLPSWINYYLEDMFNERLIDKRNL